MLIEALVKFFSVASHSMLMIRPLHFPNCPKSRWSSNEYHLPSEKVSKFYKLVEAIFKITENII